MPNVMARGRPDTDTNRWRARMAQLFKQVFTDDDVIEVMEHVRDEAKTSGDIQWAQLFLAYAVGKPTSSDESQSSRLQIEGDLNIQINQLSDDELRVLSNLNVYESLPSAPPQGDAT